MSGHRKWADIKRITPNPAVAALAEVLLDDLAGEEGNSGGYIIEGLAAAGFAIVNRDALAGALYQLGIDDVDLEGSRSSADAILSAIAGPAADHDCLMSSACGVSGFYCANSGPGEPDDPPPFVPVEF
jgi:hypothetical protein